MIPFIDEGDVDIDMDVLDGDFMPSPGLEAFILPVTIIVVIIIITAAYMFKRKAKKPAEKESDDSDKILDLIKKEGGRTTQKEIRQKSGLSEARISLIITDLEDKKLVRKIKKGGGMSLFYLRTPPSLNQSLCFHQNPEYRN